MLLERELRSLIFPIETFSNFLCIMVKYVLEVDVAAQPQGFKYQL